MAEKPASAAIGAGCTCSAYWIDGKLVNDTTRCPIHSPLRDLSPAEKREVPLAGRECVQQGRPCHDHCPHIYAEAPPAAKESR
jgi:hypothetical protein